MDLASTTEEVMDKTRGRARRSLAKQQEIIDDSVVPDAEGPTDVPLTETAEAAPKTEDIVDVPAGARPPAPSDNSSTEISPYFPTSTPSASTRRLRPRTFKSPIKVPPLLLAKRVTRSSLSRAASDQKQEKMAGNQEDTRVPATKEKPERPPSTRKSAKKPSKEEAPKQSSPKETPSKTKSRSRATVPADADLLAKYGEDFDWEEYARFCMRSTRLPSDPSITTVIENIREYGNWQGEKSGSTANSSKKRKAAETTAEPKEKKHRTKEERKREKELKKQRKEERRRRKEEKKQQKEREGGDPKKKHRHRKRKEEGEEEGEKEEQAEGAENTAPKPKTPVSASAAKSAKSRKRKADESEAPKSKRSKGSAIASTDVENAGLSEETSPSSKSVSPAEKSESTTTTALETVSESVLNLASNSPTKRIPAGTSIIIPPPVDAERFGLIQEEVCHNPYYLLIATVFLQKTKGSSAIPVYREFLKRWPTPGDLLASGTMAEVEAMFNPLGLFRTRAKTVWMMAHHFHLLDPYKKPRGQESWKIRRDYCPTDPTGQNRRWGCIIGDVYGCGTYAIDSWRIFCMKPGEGGFIDGTTVGKPQKRKTNDGDETPTLPVVIYQNEFAPGDEEWRRIPPDRGVLDKELQAYIRWMHAKDAAGFGTASETRV